MISVKHHLVDLPPQALDAYLEKGWFRMNQTLFITHFLHFENQFYPAVWLRYAVNRGIDELAGRKLRAIEKRFRVEVNPWHYTPQQERLYAAYRAFAGFNITETLHELLMGYEEVNHFRTWQVEIYADKRLVALGIFDAGEKTAAGIANIYDPDFRKYSLGKALIYAKLQHICKAGFSWFYPGYAVPGNRSFNYKLDIAPEYTEYFCPVKRQWFTYEQRGGLPDLLSVMEQKLRSVQQKVSMPGKNYLLMYYQRFDASLLGLHFADLLHYPMFLLLGYDATRGHWLIGVYDLELACYKVVFCHTVYTAENSFSSDKWICTDLLQVQATYLSELDGHQMQVFMESL